MTHAISNGATHEKTDKVARTIAPYTSMKLSNVIDLFKGLTLPFCVLCIIAYKQHNNMTACIYAATHGAYGLCWCTKSQLFPDKSWEKEVTIFEAVISSIMLALYWVAPWLICASSTNHPPSYVATCVFIYALGIFLHFSSDSQKYFTMRLRKGLISDGLFTLCRNPNYFGELLIYLSFVLLAVPHWFPTAYLAFLICFLWVPSMAKKDESLSRHEGFKAYALTSWMLFPKLLPRFPTIV